ncbi:MAG: sulfite exporter TauE/SafE family protein [Deltaproteobacteria bacterium]|nr:sulfite exporter TauE/SafE family protein [Deltaproteobacteria bacterium]
MANKFLGIGCLAGFFSGLLGIGGGLVMIPLLTFWGGFSQKEAYGTSLVAIIFAGIFGSVAYHFHGTLDVIAAVIIASAAMGSSFLGVRYCNRQPEWKLKRFFGFFLILSVALLLSKPYFTSLVPSAGFSRVLLLVFIGTLGGFLSGLLGVGSGGIMVAGMVVFAGMEQVSAQGTALLVMVPTGIVGAYAHWRRGNVRTEGIVRVILGILCGSVLGASVAHAVSVSVLLFCFCAVLLVMACKYLATKKQ